jgi:hypothetical protein
MRAYAYLVCSIVLVAAIALLLAGCSSGTSSANSAMVQVSVSDPATCAAPQGPFSHIYVTVTDVLIHQSATAPDNDPGWVDLTPGLSKNPVQVDLLGVANQCFLAQLGSNGIKPGSYQQIRILLAANGTVVANDRCAGSANCVTLTTDPTNTPQMLQLSSESQTGIKIPSGQIAGGKFTVAAGDNKDLNLDFDACASIVAQGNGKYRLKPVMHAGEVTLQSSSTSISGKVIDGVTTQAMVGGTTVVAIEQNNNGTDRVFMETVADSTGGFSFCPLPAGTYDVVVTAVNGAGGIYAATVITGVQPGDSLGNVPLTPTLAPASIAGMVTTSTGNAATSADLSVSALQSITVNNATIMITVPLPVQSMATATISTGSGAGCPMNTDCANYTLAVPASNPSVGTFIANANQAPAAPAPGTVMYTVDALAFVPGSAGQSDCSPAGMQTNQTNSNAPLVVVPGTSVTASTLTFTGCQ